MVKDMIRRFTDQSDRRPFFIGSCVPVAEFRCALPLQSTRPSCQLQLIEARIRFTWLGDVVMKQVRTCCPRGRLYLELRAVAFDLDGPSSLLAESASGGEGILHELEIHDLPVAHLCVDRER
jgi:hypothetical protein